MEAKDTVMNEQGILDACIGASIPPSVDFEIELLVAQAQAEISFKAGREEEHKVMIDLAVDEGNKAFKAGIKEMVEWIDEHSRMTYEHGKGEVAFNHVQWHTKLKEWGIE